MLESAGVINAPIFRSSSQVSDVLSKRSTEKLSVCSTACPSARYRTMISPDTGVTPSTSKTRSLSVAGAAYGSIRMASSNSCSNISLSRLRSMTVR